MKTLNSQFISPHESLAQESCPAFLPDPPSTHNNTLVLAAHPYSWLLILLLLSLMDHGFCG